jgi:DNA-binding Xre family transcriptional regulator
MNLSKSIKVSLAKRGVTQSWLAQRMGVSSNAVSKLCVNNKSGTDRLVEICHILEMPLSDFIALGEEHSEVFVNRTASLDDRLDRIKKEYQEKMMKQHRSDSNADN